MTVSIKGGVISEVIFNLFPSLFALGWKDKEQWFVSFHVWRLFEKSFWDYLTFNKCEIEFRMNQYHEMPT